MTEFLDTSDLDLSPEQYEAAIAEILETGTFDTRERVLRAAVALLLDRHRKFMAFLDAGFEGESIPAEQVFEELRALIPDRRAG